MKPFTVNTNSWHYKLNVKLCKTNDRLHSDKLAETYVKSKDNLCSYWRMTTWSVIKVLAVTSFISLIIGSILFFTFKFGMILYTNPISTIITTSIVLAVFTVIIGFLVGLSKLDTMRKNKLDRILYQGETETSLAKAKYSSWKNGFCMPVEFK